MFAKAPAPGPTANVDRMTESSRPRRRVAISPPRPPAWPSPRARAEARRRRRPAAARRLRPRLPRRLRPRRRPHRHAVRRPPRSPSPSKTPTGPVNADYKHFDPKNFGSPLGAKNRWFPLVPGNQSLRDGSIMRGSRRLHHQKRLTVTDVVKEINGVQAVVLLDQDIDAGQNGRPRSTTSPRTSRATSGTSARTPRSTKAASSSTPTTPGWPGRGGPSRGC